MKLHHMVIFLSMLTAITSCGTTSNTISNTPVLPKIDGEYFVDSVENQRVSQDWGQFTQRIPQVLAKVSNEADIAKIVKYGKAANIKLQPRGTGHSTEGNSLSDGLVVVFEKMNKVFPVNKANGTIRAQAGARLYEVLAQAVKHEMTFKAQPHYIGQSVGGLLSANGIGPGSFKHGMTIDNVVEVKVVTGTGEILTATKTHNSDLFFAVLGGQGQFGIITEAVFKLQQQVKTAKMVEYMAMYANQQAFLLDLDKATAQQKYFDVWGDVRTTATGTPFPYLYILHITVDRNDEDTVATPDAFFEGYAGIPGQRMFLPMSAQKPIGNAYEVLTKLNFYTAIDLNKGVPAPGKFVWYDTYISKSQLKAALNETLAAVVQAPVLSPIVEQQQLILLQPLKAMQRKYALTQLPEGQEAQDSHFYDIGILQTVVTDDDTALAIARNDRLTTHAASLGGKSHLIDSPPVGIKGWQLFFGSKQNFDASYQTKQKFDPNNIFETLYQDSNHELNWQKLADSYNSQ
jgi:cytokinin dehydrogenase